MSDHLNRKFTKHNGIIKALENKLITIDEAMIREIKDTLKAIDVSVKRNNYLMLWFHNADQDVIYYGLNKNNSDDRYLGLSIGRELVLYRGVYL